MKTLDEHNNYKYFRKDGWPLCPGCGQDELYADYTYLEDAMKRPTIENIAGCYACDFKPNKLRK